VRLRPDQLYHKPFPLAINVSVAEWPEDRVLRPAGQEGVALMPQVRGRGRGRGRGRVRVRVRGRVNPNQGRPHAAG
jgi:hypothetical protein